jgi:hypothetical protein
MPGLQNVDIENDAEPRFSGDPKRLARRNVRAKCGAKKRGLPLVATPFFVGRNRRPRRVVRRRSDENPLDPRELVVREVTTTDRTGRAVTRRMPDFLWLILKLTGGIVKLELTRKLLAGGTTSTVEETARKVQEVLRQMRRLEGDDR